MTFQQILNALLSIVCTTTTACINGHSQKEKNEKQERKNTIVRKEQNPEVHAASPR